MVASFIVVLCRPKATGKEIQRDSVVFNDVQFEITLVRYKEENISYLQKDRLNLPKATKFILVKFLFSLI